MSKVEVYVVEALKKKKKRHWHWGYNWKLLWLR